jgi:hypothetical protein
MMLGMTYSTNTNHHADESSRPFDGAPLSHRIHQMLTAVRRAHGDVVYLKQRQLDRSLDD